MAKLAIRLPDFGQEYDGRQQRAMVQQLEAQLARIRVDGTLPAYSTTGDFTVSATDDVVMVDTSGGNITVTLPEISDSMVREKFEVEIVKTEAANRITIDPSGTDTIVGETDAIVYTQWTALRMRATTGNWVIV